MQELDGRRPALDVGSADLTVGPAQRPRSGTPIVAFDGVGTPAALISYALALVAAALVALLLVANAYPVLPTISVDRASANPDAAIGFGIAFWILFGFAGSLRSQGLAGGAVVTFHMPFVIAGTILGGPLVGALMGVISLTELREFRRAPWYGILANHAIAALVAVAAGIVGHTMSWALGDLLARTDPVHTLVVGAVVAASYVTMNLVLVLPIVAMRSGAEFGTVVRSVATALRATLTAEVALGWLMAVTYLLVAWWAPVLCVVVILAVWDAHDRREALRRDQMTGLLNDAGVQPLLESALDEARRYGRRHALLFIDLDRFGQLNKVHGSDVGDDVLRAVAMRIAAAVRSTDVVGRQNRAGDEFLILFRDLPDDETASRLAWRLHATILKPVRVRGESLVVEVGASIGIAMMLPGAPTSLHQVKRIADDRMQSAKRAGGGVLGPG
ncbi:MAG TPA: GGDEF domain-containing protein [Candidatus Angelobacter sp.]|nr:GGDEF domain-containing protein [Candidatus Angelobacter sp.]